ncbi:MAG: molybdate ABC transporter substrate-binding protein [Armatimonadota bacterium]
MRGFSFVAICVLLSVGPSSAWGGPVGSLSVFAAASLTEAFTLLGNVLEQRRPSLRITHNFAGSQQLATQIEQGARADVFASADQRWMDYLQQRGLVAGIAREFARNRLVVIVPRSNQARITRLQDLANPRVKVVLAADAVPVGRYSREALEKLNRAPGFPQDYAQRVLRNVVSQEENVRGVVAKVQLGEADAGIVYRSDVTPATAERVQVLDIPDRHNVLASYPMAVLKAASNPDAAAAFVSLVLSSLGQRVLRDTNLIPVVAP